MSQFGNGTVDFLRGMRGLITVLLIDKDVEGAHR